MQRRQEFRFATIVVLGTQALRGAPPRADVQLFVDAANVAPNGGDGDLDWSAISWLAYPWAMSSSTCCSRSTVWRVVRGRRIGRLLEGLRDLAGDAAGHGRAAAVHFGDGIQQLLTARA